MTFYFTLSSLHHLAVFALIGLLGAEFAVIRSDMTARDVKRLAALDIAYGITFAAILVIGLLRVFFGLKGADFYLANVFFWTKVGAFLLAALLSVVPTIRFILSGGARSPRTRPRCPPRRMSAAHSAGWRRAARDGPISAAALALKLLG